MKYSKDTTNFVRHLISNYSTFDRLSNCFVLHYDDIADFDIDELCSHIMNDNEDYACDATGPNNDVYLTKMLPALTKFLSNTTNKDAEIEYINQWREGIARYLKPTIESMLSDCLDEYNQDRGHMYSSYKSEVNVWSL